MQQSKIPYLLLLLSLLLFFRVFIHLIIKNGFHTRFKVSGEYIIISVCLFACLFYGFVLLFFFSFLYYIIWFFCFFCLFSVFFISCVCACPRVCNYLKVVDRGSFEKYAFPCKMSKPAYSYTTLRSLHMYYIYTTLEQ